MSASNNFITRPVLSTVCSLLIVIVGLISIPILPIESLPDIAPPTVNVSATYSGADAVAVEDRRALRLPSAWVGLCLLLLASASVSARCCEVLAGGSLKN